MISVVLHDAVFEPSDPFFHAANLVALLRRKQQLDDEAGTEIQEFFFLMLQHDGGADHHNQKLRVKLSLLAVKRVLGLKRLDSQRGCPNHSAALIHERCMSLLNLGIQHTSFARVAMPPEFEALVKNCSNRRQIRAVANAMADVRRCDASEDSDASDDDDDRYCDYEVVAMKTHKGGKRSFKLQQLSVDSSDDEDADRDDDGVWVREAALHGETISARVQAYLEEHVSIEERAAAAGKEEAKKAEHALRLQLPTRWQASMKPVIDLIAERFQMLELKGKPVECSEPAREVVEELHASLLELDPAYNRSLSLISDLQKMPVLAGYFASANHVFDSTYQLSLRDCDDPNCKSCCGGWNKVPEKLCSLIRAEPVLPMLDPDNPGHFYSYEKAAALSETDERALPSMKQKVVTAADKESQANDKMKELHPSKVRAVVTCVECGRPRVLYAKLLDESKPLLKKLDAFIDTVDYTCGDLLFDASADDPIEQRLAEVFYHRELLSCRDNVEIDYFNYGGLRGRTEFEHVCARCGRAPEESPLVDRSLFSATQLEGKTPLPLCNVCFSTGGKGGSGIGPVLVKRSDKVTAELERKEEKKTTKAARAKARAPEPTKRKAAPGTSAPSKRTANAPKAAPAKPKGGLHTFFPSSQTGGSSGAGSSSGGCGGRSDGGDVAYNSDDEPVGQRIERQLDIEEIFASIEQEGGEEIPLVDIHSALQAKHATWSIQQIESSLRDMEEQKKPCMFRDGVVHLL